jgi:ABC-type nitrate/sulfonate/bicarbonate transport system substrate-binding protein
MTGVASYPRLAGLLCLFLAITAQAQAPQPITVQLQWKHQFEFAGFYAAIQQGFYARHGLQVELREYQPGMDIVEEVLSGRAQYATTNSNIVRARLEGKPVKLLANYFKRMPMVILTSPKISKLADLQGKRLMVSRKDLESPLLRLAFEREDLLPGENIDIVPHTFNAEPFLHGEVDAMTAFITNEPFYLEQQGIAFNIIELADYMRSIGDVYLFTRDAHASRYPQQTEHFIKATNEGWRYALDHPEEIVDLILADYSQRKSREALLYEADKTQDMVMPLPLPIGTAYAPLIEEIAALIIRQNNIQGKNRLQHFLFDSDGATVPRKIDLTPDEQAWIAANPEILIGSNATWQPYAWRRKDGSVAGVEADLITRFNTLTGANIRLMLGDWSDIVARAKRGELHGLALSSTRPERAEHFLFSNSLYSTYQFIYTRKERQISNMKDLTGLRVGLLRGNLASEHTLRNWPKLIPVPLDSSIKLALALQKGEIDAVLSSPVLNFIIREHLLLDIYMAFHVPHLSTRQKFGEPQEL